MARGLFDSTFPASGSSFSTANFRNEFQALYQGDIAPLRPRAHVTADMGIMIAGTDTESYYRQCYSDNDMPMVIASGNVTFVAPNYNPRIDAVYASGTLLVHASGVEAAVPTVPDILSVNDGVIPIALVYHQVGETKIVNYEDKDANPSEGYLYRDIRPVIHGNKLHRTSNETTGDIMKITGDSLTTGKLGYFYSNATNTSTRRLVDIVNNSTAATGTIPLFITQNASNYGLYVNAAGSASAFVSSGDGNVITITGDAISTGTLINASSNSADTTARNLAYIVNNNSLAANAKCLALYQRASAIGLDIVTEALTSAAFQITAHYLTTGHAAYIHSNSPDTSARNLVSIINEHTAAIGAAALSITQDAAAVGAHILQKGNSYGLWINATTVSSVTTSQALRVEADALTTGTVAYFASDSADTSARSLVIIVNNHSDAVGAVPLHIQQDAANVPVLKFTGNLGGNSSAVWDAADDWIQVDVNGTAYYIPLMLAT